MKTKIAGGVLQKGRVVNLCVSGKKAVVPISNEEIRYDQMRHWPRPKKGKNNAENAWVTAKSHVWNVILICACPLTTTAILNFITVLITLLTLPYAFWLSQNVLFFEQPCRSWRMIPYVIKITFVQKN